MDDLKEFLEDLQKLHFRAGVLSNRNYEKDILSYYDIEFARMDIESAINSLTRRIDRRLDKKTRVA